MNNVITKSLLILITGSIVLLSLAIASLAFVAPPPTVSETLEAAPDAPVQSALNFQTDPDTGTVTFRVDGKTILEIDSSGITVTGNIQYTGGITDIGDDVPANATAGEAN